MQFKKKIIYLFKENSEIAFIENKFQIQKILSIYYINNFIINEWH